MPPLDQGPVPAELKLLLAALAVAALGLAFAFPLVAAALVGLYLLGGLSRRRHFARLRAAREGESICTFARALDLRTVDPWIARAVWDDLQPYARSDGRDFPIRPADDITDDLCVDPDDLDDLASRSAQRVGRSMNGAEQNPFYGSVRTVGDLARFLNAQPVVGTA